jgi:hypothetical protein
MYKSDWLAKGSNEQSDTYRLAKYNGDFIECTEYIEELDKLLNQKRMLILYFGSLPKAKSLSEKLGNIMLISEDDLGPSEWKTRHLMFQFSKQTQETSVINYLTGKRFDTFDEIYCIFDREISELIASQIKGDEEATTGGLLGQSKTYILRSQDSRDASYIDSGKWYPSVLKQKFRGSFTSGLSMGGTKYPFDLLCFLLAFISHLPYAIRVGSMQESLQELFKTALVYSLGHR